MLRDSPTPRRSSLRDCSSGVILYVEDTDPGREGSSHLTRIRRIFAFKGEHFFAYSGETAKRHLTFLSNTSQLTFKAFRNRIKTAREQPKSPASIICK